MRVGRGFGVVALLTAAALPHTTALDCLSDADLARIAATGQQALESHRYTVTTRGKEGPFDFSFAPANYTHAGVNPSSRYVVPRLGPWREGDIGGDSFLNWGIGEVDTLTSRQAVVIVMCTPPPTRLWSLEAAVLYRLNLTANLSPGASISNTENSATLASVKESTPLVVVMTPDRATEAAVRAAFEIAGENLTVTTIAINGTSSVLNFGTRPLAQGCDMFQFCMRVHASPSQTAAPEFQSYLGRKFPILLVEPSFQAADQPLYPIADRPMRSKEAPEGSLSARCEVLGQAVASTLQSTGLTPKVNVSFHPVVLDKRRCLVDRNYHPYGTGNCYGTSSDGRYTLSDPYTLPGGNLSSLVLVVVGVNHVASGNACDNQLLYGTTVAVNPEGMEGSAEFFLGTDSTPPDANLFARAFAVRCPSVLGTFCTEVPLQTGGGVGELLRLEAYLDPQSGTRPSVSVLHPTATLFTAP